MSVFELWGVKKNKFKVKMKDIGTNRLACPTLNEATPTKTLIKKRVKKMHNEAQNVIDNKLEKTKKMFENFIKGKILNNQAKLLSKDDNVKGPNENVSDEVLDTPKIMIGQKVQDINIVQDNKELNKYGEDYQWENHDYQKMNESDDSGLPESGTDDSSDDEK